jgi:hypothetical protein
MEAVDFDGLLLTEEEIMSAPSVDTSHVIAPPASIVILDTIEREIKEMNVRYQVLHWLHYAIKTTPPSEEIVEYLIERING